MYSTFLTYCDEFSNAYLITRRFHPTRLSRQGFHVQLGHFSDHPADLSGPLPLRHSENFVSDAVGHLLRVSVFSFFCDHVWIQKSRSSRQTIRQVSIKQAIEVRNQSINRQPNKQPNQQITQASNLSTTNKTKNTRGTRQAIKTRNQTINQPSGKAGSQASEQSIKQAGKTSSYI